MSSNVSTVNSCNYLVFVLLVYPENKALFCLEDFLKKTIVKVVFINVPKVGFLKDLFVSTNFYNSRTQEFFF